MTAGGWQGTWEHQIQIGGYGWSVPVCIFNMKLPSSCMWAEVAAPPLYMVSTVVPFGYASVRFPAEVNWIWELWLVVLTHSASSSMDGIHSSMRILIGEILKSQNELLSEFYQIKLSHKLMLSCFIINMRNEVMGGIEDLYHGVFVNDRRP